MSKALSARFHRTRVLLALAWYSRSIHRGITRYAHDVGWILDVGFVRNRMALHGWRGDGVICVLGIEASTDAMIRKLGLPTVNIGYQRMKGAATVAADSAAVGQLAAEHFLSRGFKHFAFYETNRGDGELVRRDGFEKMLWRAGVRVHRIGLPAAGSRKSKVTPAQRDQIVGRQLSAIPKPVAVLAEYDDKAIEVIDAALASNLRVPEQVAVLGVDNDELLCTFAPVPLSSIDNDEERIGFEAARQLHRLLRGKPCPKKPVLIEPRSVVVRQSTNILAIQHEHVAMALRFIWEHYTKPIDAKRVGASVPLSYTQIHRSFIQHVGHSLAEEIERLRLAHARQLLTTTDLKLSEVARQSGFGSADRMGRVFRRVFRSAPSEYRQTMNVEDDAQSGVRAIDPLPKPAALSEVGRVE